VPDLLVHEQVEAVVEVAPHVRVEVDPSDALRMRRGRNVVGENEGSREPVEDDVLDVEELTDAVPGTA
jgi:hypothetical protein